MECYLDWAPVLGPLANRLQVVALDLPGFGNSEKPGTEYAADFFFRSLGRFFEAMDLRKPTPVGNSFGGQIAPFLGGTRCQV
jgi:pimeloyl-ACP methyl ester carboxylesterase